MQPADGRLSDLRSGKVRESYHWRAGQRLMVTSDRISAFDRVLAEVPYKGQVLNQLSAWWFERTADILANHLIAVPDPSMMIVRAAQPLPIEVIVRGFITGVTSTSLWHRYELGERTIYGHTLPHGLTKNQALPQPLITPTTKAEKGGHDERLTVEEVVSQGLVARPLWERVQHAALGLFQRGQELASQRGFLLVDTKYEFGLGPNGELLLIDEVHTPDSSRYWLASSRSEEGEPRSFDKEWVRLAYVRRGYRGEGEPPLFSSAFWQQVSQLYIDLYEKITGVRFQRETGPLSERLERLCREAPATGEGKRHK